MITYRSNKYGLIWQFELHENSVVFWRGEHPDWLVAPRSDLNKLVKTQGGRKAANLFLASRLDENSVCIITQPLTFSEL